MPPWLWALAQIGFPSLFALFLFAGLQRVVNRLMDDQKEERREMRAELRLMRTELTQQTVFLARIDAHRGLPADEILAARAGEGEK